jgi:hypothetical protein
MAHAMKYIYVAFLAACLCTLQTGISADKPRLRPSTNASDAEACLKQLNTIYGAVLEYRKRNQSFPLWLSELVPDYIQDPNTLVCPYVRNTGDLKQWREKFLLGKVFKDPRDCSYAYEFCAEKWFPGWTTRTYKERQMELVGFSVPIVRCVTHRRVLNLGLDGSLYPSSNEWEDIFVQSTNQMAVFHNVALLTNIAANHLVARLSLPRQADTDSRMLDLSPQYNASLLHLSQMTESGKLLRPYREGPQKIAGIDFDVRALVHLGARHFPIAFPETVQHIPVNRKCASIHFLHGATSVVANGTRIGSFAVRFRARNPVIVPIIYGKDVEARWFDPDEPSDADNAKPAWTSPADKVGATGKSLRLYATSWTNKNPESQVESIDFASDMTESAPFLLAITVE